MESSILSLAQGRKTVRKFLQKTVAMDDIYYCIGVAREAPSGMNAQPWQFLLVTDAQQKKVIRTLCEKREQKFHRNVTGALSEWLQKKSISWEKPFLEDAPALLFILSSRTAPYATHSTWLAVGYLLLALEERGISTVTYTPPHPEKLCIFLGIPDEFKVEVILPLGYSADEKPKEERMPLEELVHMGEWGNHLMKEG